MNTCLNLSAQPLHLVDLLRQRAQNQPDKTAYIFLENGETETGSLTYRELDQQAQAIATTLQSLVAPGERALMLYPSGLEFIAAFFGCLYAGVVAVPAYPPRQNQRLSRLQAIVADAQAKVSLTTNALLSNIQAQFVPETELADLHCLATDQISVEQAQLWQEPALSSSSIAFLQYTSGATGTPKGVMVSHGNLLHNCEYMRQAFELTSESVSVSWLPSFHDMGLIFGILEPLYTGFPEILMPSASFAQQPIRWLQAISRYRATHSGGPNFAYDLCINKITQEQLETLDLSTWRCAYNGAEPVRQQTLEGFATKFKPCGFRSNFLYPCYGMAEATLMISGGRVDAEPVYCTVEADGLEHNRITEISSNTCNVKHWVGCGREWLDTKVVIADPESLTQCPPNQIGEIWISGCSVAQGYWRRPEQTKQTFKAQLQDTGEEPFLRTGDLGFLKNGELFITGRLKDLIIIRGRNHYPQDIELTVQQSHPALRPECGAAFSVELNGTGKLVIVQEVERSYLRKLNANEVIETICRVVAQEHDIEVDAVLLLKTASIPKTSSGKIQRSACRSGFLTGSLDVVADWSVNPEHKTQFQHLESEVESLLQQVKIGKQPTVTNQSDAPAKSQQKSQSPEAIASWLISKIARQLQVLQEKIDIGQPLANYGLSSLAAVSISGELQEWLGCELSPTLLYDYPTIESLVLYLGGLETGINKKDPPQSPTTYLVPIQRQGTALFPV
jgi:acyl-CoA synthetase (AMP-forming)/AMP-acid ligase II/acyl carrier protein